MRIEHGLLVTFGVLTACATRPTFGALSEGMGGTPTIISVDTMRPPTSMQVELERNAYIAVVAVAPGHSATLLYPSDGTTDNRLDAGTRHLDIEIPAALIRNDSAALAERRRQQQAEDRLLRARARGRSTRGTALGPLPPNTPVYLLLLTSQQALSYDRILDKTAGVSIPTDDLEALHAVGKAVRSTLGEEPKVLAGYYQLVELNRIR